MSAGRRASPIVRAWRWLRNRSSDAGGGCLCGAVALVLAMVDVAIGDLRGLLARAAALIFDYRLSPVLKRPIGYLPFAFFGLVAVGTLWSDAPWRSVSMPLVRR